MPAPGMLFEQPAKPNYRTTAALVGAHSAAGRSLQALAGARTTPQLTLVHTAGTRATREVVRCAAKGEIQQEMVRSHWTPTAVAGAAFEAANVVADARLPASGVKPQQLRGSTREEQSKLARLQHAGVDSAFGDPVQRLAHHPWHNSPASSAAGASMYESSNAATFTAPPAEARRRVPQSLTLRTHNDKKVSASYTSSQMPITDVLESHFTLAHAQHHAPAASSTAAAAGAAAAASAGSHAEAAVSHYATTSGLAHSTPASRSTPSRGAGVPATHALMYDTISHRTRVSTAIAPFEHFDPQINVRRAIPKSTQDSYNIITGLAIPRTHTQTSRNELGCC